MLRKTFDEGGDGCELISDQVFQYLSLPRISPDGKRLALGGSGEPNMGPSGCGGDPRSKPAAGGLPASLDLVAWLRPAVAYAHGLPADVYTLNLDGSNMTRIADIKDDDPTVAWSPDGAKLAIFGVGGPVRGRRARRAHRQAGRPGRLRRARLDWAAPSSGLG